MKQHVFLIALLLVALWACEKDENENKLPTEPVLLLPANGSVVDLSKLEFDFSGGTDPENAQVRNILKVSEDSVTWYELKTHVNGFECELEFKEGLKYYWKVQCFEYDESAYQVISGRMTESKVFHFYTNAPNVFELKAESSSHTNWTGRNFVKLTWLEPENTDYVEVTFEPQVDGIQQPIQVPAGQGELLLEDFFDNWVPLKQEDAKVYTFEVKAVSTDGLPSVPDTIRAMPLDKLLVHDYDFNVYGTVMINNQVWLDRNLMTTHFNQGTPISTYSKGLDKKEYGYYYTARMFNQNWDKTLCPCGFHIPTEKDWQILELFLGVKESELENWGRNGVRGDSNEAGNKLKSLSGWDNRSNGLNGNGSDLFGFNALPTGYILYDYDKEKFVLHNEGRSAGFWTVTTKSLIIDMRILYNDKAGIYLINNDTGAAIRCIRDN